MRPCKGEAFFVRLFDDVTFETTHKYRLDEAWRCRLILSNSNLNRLELSA